MLQGFPQCSAFREVGLLAALTRRVPLYARHVNTVVASTHINKQMRMYSESMQRVSQRERIKKYLESGSRPLFLTGRLVASRELWFWRQMRLVCLTHLHVCMGRNEHLIFVKRSNAGLFLLMICGYFFVGFSLSRSLSVLHQMSSAAESEVFASIAKVA